MQDVVLTIVGSDRPGLVELNPAEAVARAGGNWLESRMARLAGQFAGILRVQASMDAIPHVIEAIEGLSHAELKVSVELGTAGPIDTERSLELDSVGLDRPGIVRDISGVLARHGANIEELVTDTSSAPMSGSSPFRAHIRLTVPSTADLGRLRTELEQFATDLVVELRLIETVTTARVKPGHGHGGRHRKP